MKKQDLRDLYEAYAKPGMERWKQIYRQADDDLAFLLWATDLILDDLEPTEEEVINACRLDGKWDLKIDSGFYDREEKRIYLIQAKHRGDPGKSIDAAPFFETWESLELLSNEKLVQKANTFTRDFYVEFSEAVKQQSEIVLCIATSARILQPQKDYVENKPKKRKIQVGDRWYEVPITFKYFGLPELVEIERAGESTGIIPGDKPVSIPVGQGWYCVPPNATGKEMYDTLYTTIPAEHLVTIRQRLGPDLYRLNYRGPLGERIVVNKDILGTLSEIPEFFHVLNNGLAAICDQFTIDIGSGQVEVKGLQIVNGCQTMETIYSRASQVIGKKTNAKVNVRLVTCQPSQSALVAQATNNQTKLRAEDFATLDQIQQVLQVQFAKLQPQPWYYEIKRRYWKSVIFKDKAERQRFSDESDIPRIIRLRDAAQRSLAFLGEPITAAQNTAQIFKKKDEGGYKEYVFPSNLYAYQILLPWMVYQRINEDIDSYLEQIPEFEEKSTAREWLEYGRLTAVALVGDGLREYYNVKPLEYLDFQRSRHLVENLDDWLKPLARHASLCIWNYAKSNKDWLKLGPRATFRRPPAYETELHPTFMASFQTSKDVLTRGLVQTLTKS